MIETYEEFVSRLMNRIAEESSEEISFSRRSILKNNNKRLDAITVCRAGYDLCPTIYPEFYYQQYQKGEDFETLLMRIMEGIRHEITAERIDLKNVSDFHRMKDKVVFRLINASRNQELLSDLAHVLYLDLAIVFACVVSVKEEETASFLIHEEHLMMWNTTVEELFELAKDNTPRLFPACCQDLSDVIEKEYPKELPPLGNLKHECMYVLSNQHRIHGASCILYRHILKEIGEKMGCDLYIIPSSVHETLIIPSRLDLDVSQFRKVIMEVNATAVSEEEYLSDHAYLYKRKSNKLQSIA
ncbi:MAG: DUF5688 family protein [Lachnospiraceae bacterium]|nr:DUF5688 family protein [Lachnospiraceae bacterium]